MSEERGSRLDRAVAAMRAADSCGCTPCARLALLAALRVVMAEPSDAAALEGDRPYAGDYARVRAAFAADLAELETEARRG